jgi:predicted glycosyltransferase involved in capsule biosynthesis
MITSNKDLILDLATVNDFQPAMPGSTGGSILVRRDTFLSVGGFDPELFYGYGPEDSFFWSKLETLEKRVDPINWHFAGGGMFADDPPIDVYHMYHEPKWFSNPDEPRMLDIRHSFWHYQHEEKCQIVAEKRRILQEALQS